MNKKQKYKKITKSKIFLILIISILLQTISVNAGLNIVLANQNPEPATAGSIVEINLKISNSGDKEIDSVQIELIETENFKLVDGYQKIRELGPLSPYSSIEGSTSYVYERFIVEISPNTPQGLNPIKFKLKTTEGITTKRYEYKFDIKIEDKNPILKVNSITIPEIEPGKTQTLEIELENPNPIYLKNIQIDLKLNDVESTILSTNGPNQKIIEKLESKEKKKITFTLNAGPNAESKNYLLPIVITYKDSLNNIFTNEIIGSIKVYSKPTITLNIEEQTIFTTGKGKITYYISNPGTSILKGVELELLESENYEILKGKNQYIGDLNPDDYQTSQAEIYIKNLNAKPKIKITYYDSFNQKITQIKELNLKLYEEKKLKEYGITTKEENSNKLIYILLILIIIAGTYYTKKQKTKK